MSSILKLRNWGIKFESLRRTLTTFRNPVDTENEKYRVSVVNDARLMALGGATRDGLFQGILAEFQCERVSATRRAEEKLGVELMALNGLSNGLASPAKREAFIAKRKLVLKLRTELVIQREASGLLLDTANRVEIEFPVPPAQ